MSINLRNAGHRFRSHFHTEQGIPFAGTLLPASEGNIPGYDFTYRALILRVAPECPFKSGTVISAANGETYLMADHDQAVLTDQVLYRTHRLFRMTNNIEWRRETTTLDPLTNVKKGTGTELLGNIWCQIEQYGREMPDNALRISDERHRLVTGHPITLGDLVDKRVVKRVNKVLGIWMAEIQ